MATVSPVIFKHHFKKNKTVNVKFRLSSKKRSIYIPTQHHLSKNDVTSKWKIKQPYIDKHLALELTLWREAISDLGIFANEMPLEELRVRVERTLKRGSGGGSIDVVKFARGYVVKLQELGKQNSAMPLTTAINHLIDFSGEVIYAQDITSRFLRRFESFLSKPREIVRSNYDGGLVRYKLKGLSDQGIAKVMANVRLLFNKARDEFNDEEIGVIPIPNYPFSNYKVRMERVKTGRALSVDVIRRVASIECLEGKARLARDMFMLSFYLCGINSVDIYGNIARFRGVDRASYSRSKTKHRSGGSFISVPIPPLAADIIERYAGVADRYVNSRSFNKVINQGLKEVAAKVGLENITHYYARHSFATIARNECGFSKDDIAVALNHVDSHNAVTDLYIKTDWSIIDKVQKGVLDLVFATAAVGAAVGSRREYFNNSVNPTF